MINFDDNFILGKYSQNYLIRDYFPEIPKNKKIGVFVSGGMESTLIAKICQELYGAEQTLFFYTDDIFLSDNNNDNSKNILYNNVENIEKILNQKVDYLYINKKRYDIDTLNYAAEIASNLKKQYNIEYMLIGFTDLFWKLEKLKQPNISINDLEKTILNNKEFYKELIEELHFFTDSYLQHIYNIDINPNTWTVLKNPNLYCELSPFRTLNKHAVVDMYMQLGWHEILYKTNSCVDIDNIHCGECFNCQQRYDGFNMLNLVDPTEYKKSIIKDRRENLRNHVQLYKF